MLVLITVPRAYRVTVKTLDDGTIEVTVEPIGPILANS